VQGILVRTRLSLRMAAEVKDKQVVMSRINTWKNLFKGLLIVISGQLMASSPVGAQGTGRVAVHASNPRYLQDPTGKPVFILGWGNEGRNKAAILDRLRNKINYQRAYVALWGRKNDPNAYDGGRPWPMVGSKADMDVWNEMFWVNLRNYIENARDRGITIGLTIWDGHYDLPGGKAGADSVWQSQYNVQNIQWAYDYRALANFPNPKRTAGTGEKLVYYQRRWIDRLINEVRNYPNVIIELDNETDEASESWFLWWADYFIQKGNFVIATTWNSRYTISDETFSKDPRLHIKFYHSRSDDAITPTRLSWNKVIVADADNKCSNLDATSARKIAWRSFLKGGHWNDFVCAGTRGFPDTTKTQYYGHLLDFIKTRGVPFVEMMPSNNLISTGTALAKPGLYYLAYVEGRANLDLTTALGVLDYEWYNPRTGNRSSSGQVEGRGVRTFSLPASGDFVLWVRAAPVASTNSIPR
jgi:Putative collagen-binding domain of a collagenase